MAGELRIPFNQVCMEGRELDYMRDVLAEGQIAGNGAFGRRCEELLERELGASHALLTTSCTHALELAALLLDLEAGDEVILPSFTFVSTANAFVLRGALPVFADVRADTLNLDETQLSDLVSERTRCIVPVHYAGVGCEMEPILELGAKHGIDVVEDNAHGLFGRYRDRPLGSLGRMATQSFHSTKNFTCGEGGALLLNDPALAERAEVLREKGTDRGRFFRGEVDKYTWVDIGSSYVLTEILAAFLLAQLQAAAAIQAKRKAVWQRYHDGLGEWAREHGVRLPTVPPHCEQAYHMFYLLLPEPQQRGQLIAHLRERGILAVFHYVPLHLSAMGGRYGGRAGQCPVAERASDRLLRLPFFNGLERDDQLAVIEAVTAFGP